MRLTAAMSPILPQTSFDRTGPPSVAAIVLNWNGFDDTCIAVDSLLAQTWQPLSVHVVDNGSANNEAARLEARFGARIRLHRHATNKGFPGGHNDLLRALLDQPDGPRYLALLNNDASAAPDWIAELIACAERHPDTGACASLMRFRDRPDLVENAGVVLLRSGEAIPRGRGQPVGAFANEAELLGVCAGAALFRAEALRDVGLFRDDFFLNFEDVDLSLRLVIAGWRCRFAPGAQVHHGLGQSIRKVRDEAFEVRSMRNLDFAYLVNMPWQVLVCGLPWLLLGWLLAPIVCLLLGRRAHARTLLRGHWRLLRDRKLLLAERRALRPLRRRAWWQIFALQGSTAALYGRYLRDVVVLRRREALR